MMESERRADGSLVLRDQVRAVLGLGTLSNRPWIGRASAVSASLLLAAAAASPARGQAPYRIDKVPGTSFDMGSSVGPAWADIDADGDGDLLIAAEGGPLKLLRNVGNATEAAFELALEGAHQAVDGSGFGSPALADLDNDGDLDLVIGDELRYFENIGDDQSPEWVEATANPFAGVSSQGFLAFADLDADGDLDSLLSDVHEEISLLENVGSASIPAFVDWSLTPFSSPPSGQGTLGDWDGDGDYDLVVVRVPGFYSDLRYWENIGSSTAPFFEMASSVPFGFVSIDKYGSPPATADIDGDGDLDLIFGGKLGVLKLVENTGSSLQPAFMEATSGPLGGIDVNLVQFAGDLDSDGDFDLVTGIADGGDQLLFFMENTGSSSEPAFVQSTAPLFSGLNLTYSDIVLVDLDADADLDLVAGNSYQYLGLFENIGDVSQPAFEESLFNPFHAIDSKPFGLSDLDNDGDQDLVLRDGGSLILFENTGDASVPGYLEATTNPFAGIDVAGQGSPVLVDVDRDSDVDAALSATNGVVVFLRNVGTPQSPAFTDDGSSLLDGIEVPHGTGGRGRGLTLVDLDGDGDLDAVVANSRRLVLYRSEAAVFGDGFESGSTVDWSSASP